MTILYKIINSLAGHLPLNPASEREMIETYLRRLPQAVYWRLREKQFKPGAIIDIGAHEGTWARTIRTIFPHSPVLMIEAREEQKSRLETVCSDLQEIEYVIALLGREPQEAVKFHACDTGSSIFAERSNAPRTQRVLSMRTLDDVCSQFSLAAPLFLKLDIQGGELECLRGATATLRKTEVIQLEVALLHYNDGAPKASEIIEFMEMRGFAMFDIAGFVRPNGIDLVQIDIVFVRKNSPMRPDFVRFERK